MKSRRRKKLYKTLKIVGLVVLAVIFVALLINCLLSLFKEDYYPTFGNKRLFAVVSDSMEPEIKTGSMIACRVPESEDEIDVGTVITFRYNSRGISVLLTHRVIRISTVDGVNMYFTQGDNADGEDAGFRTYRDVVGIYTGGKCAVLGYFAGFLQSSGGAVTLIVICAIIAFASILIGFVDRLGSYKSVETAALNKSAELLKSGNFIAADDVCGAIETVVGDARTLKEEKDRIERLNAFLAKNIELSAQIGEDIKEEDNGCKDENIEDYYGFSAPASDAEIALCNKSAYTEEVKDEVPNVSEEDGTDANND